MSDRERARSGSFVFSLVLCFLCVAMSGVFLWRGNSDACWALMLAAFAWMDSAISNRITDMAINGWRDALREARHDD